MIETLLSDLQQQSVFDVIVLVTGIIYVVLAARNNPQCWIWGIISCGVLAVMTVTKYKLYADGLLNVFYVVMGVIGLWGWRSNQPMANISRLTMKEIVTYVIVGLLIAFLMSELLSEYTPAAATKLDSVTTSFSIIATIWLVQRKLENWLLWIIVDVLYIYLYFSRSAPLYGVLFIIYAIVAIRGYFFWMKEYRTVST